MPIMGMFGMVGGARIGRPDVAQLAFTAPLTLLPLLAPLQPDPDTYFVAERAPTRRATCKEPVRLIQPFATARTLPLDRANRAAQPTESRGRCPHCRPRRRCRRAPNSLRATRCASASGSGSLTCGCRRRLAIAHLTRAASALTPRSAPAAIVPRSFREQISFYHPGEGGLWQGALNVVVSLQRRRRLVTWPTRCLLVQSASSSSSCRAPACGTSMTSTRSATSTSWTRVSWPGRRCSRARAWVQQTTTL